MVLAKPRRRMTLLELLTHVEKDVHALREYVRTCMWSALDDVQRVGRPVRKHSHYPTMLTLHNSLENLNSAGGQGLARMFAGLNECLEEIDQHLQRDRDRM